MTTATTSPVDRLAAILREAAVLKSIDSLLDWDQETYMPKGGAELRAEQLQQLSGIVHEKTTDPIIGELLEAARAHASEAGDARLQADLREAQRDYDKATRLPKDLVEEMARCRALGMTAWRDARQNDDFDAFLPWLEKTVELNRRKAECYGVPSGGEHYDALMDDFEPGMTAARTEEIFAPLRAFTVDLLGRVTGSGVHVDRAAATMTMPIDKQREFSKRVCTAIGFDFGAGRLDDTSHPFCSGFGPGDTRITNRYREDAWLDGLSSATHEAGHAMYEQGLPKSAYFGRPLGEAVSLGIHESQSRMWENQVGRSRDFWEWGIGVAREVFGGALADVSPDAVYRAANIIEPSFIRVEADELTYNLHIMLRFDLERAMIRGDLSCKDLPGVWNERMKSDFGLTVDRASLGCLQDIHWSMGAMGYFPTYTFGNLYSAQLWEAMGEAIPDRARRVRSGDFAPILAWVREHVHAYGREFTAEELCQRATGSTMRPEPLMAYLEGKAKDVYGV
ncbi:MAG: carboxypeptidase M32 [Phycisphaerales bacterium]